MKKILEIFTDGAYSSIRNQGGIGIVFILNGKILYQYSNTIKNTTNNKCELIAVILGLAAIKNKTDKIIIYTDSQYVVGCATKGWERKANVSLWNLYDKMIKRALLLCDDINFVWVKGHSKEDDYKSKMNRLVDKLALEASQVIL